MAFDYNWYISTMNSLIETDILNNTSWSNVLQEMIAYAELRMQRDLDLLQTVTADSSYVFTPSNRSLKLTTGEFVTVQDVNVITPAGSPPTTGTRNQLYPVSKEFLDLIYNSSANATVPQFFAMLDNQTILVGPWPDSNYTAEVIGTVRFTPLSATNTTTPLTLYFPDMFIAASMIFASGQMRNFGSQADDPKMAVSWETQYQALLASAVTEEARKKFAASGWSAMSPPTVASQNRGSQ